MVFDNTTLQAYYPHQVLQNTCAKRYTAPVRCGFFTSLVSLSMGGYRLSVRLAAWLCTCFEIPAHPIRFKTSLVGLHQLAKETTMSSNTLTREQASQLNDFIGINTAETLDRVRAGVCDLGLVINHIDSDTAFRYANTLAAALCFEQTILEGEQA